MIPYSDIQNTIFISLKTSMLSVSLLVVVDNSRSNVTEVRVACLRKREWMWNVCFQVREENFCNMLTTLNEISAMTAKFISREVLKVLPQINPIGST